ncbi:MAG: hypothetical protein U0354_18450 [Candidatus Sericytochromatia bacterium]
MSILNNIYSEALFFLSYLFVKNPIHKLIYLNKAININPQKIKFYIARAELNSKLSKNQDAINDLKFVIKNDKNNINSLIEYASLNSEIENFNEAINTYSQLIEIYQKNNLDEFNFHRLIMTYLGRSYCYYFKKQYDDSQKDLKNAIELIEKYKGKMLKQVIVLEPLVYKISAKCNIITRNFIEAEKNLIAFKNVANSNELIYIEYLYGKILLLKGKYDIALEHFNKAISLCFNDCEFNYDLACLYSLKNDKNNALKYLKEAFILYPKYLKDVNNDKNFDNIKESHDFISLIQKYI